MSFSPLSLAFSIAPRLPLRFVMRMADVGASIAARRGGAMIDRLCANMARLTGTEPSADEVRGAVRSHIRNYAEQLMLGSRRGEPLLDGVAFEGFEALAAASEDGPVVLALGHSGSWDRAGAWVCAHGRGIVTVAEKVEPPALFEHFVSLREGLGMEIIGVAKGESVFSTLIERVRGRSVIVPLLADRDISGSGIEVDLGTRRALVAAGPAALATKLERPLFAACITYENETPTGADVRVRCVGPINADGQERPGLNRVEALTQAWVDEFAAMMATKAQDWHMMQRVYVEDLDPERLARARAEHERKNR
ncbi:phosphatidylinositol mannoside acyltransferase [Schaalia sp. ORNL0103]|uniref:phosphatidylinositol mannoside acyltransferase n=1 Tax=Schaalia sp. ORNL0103 TaxID=2789426 RepID=UPI001CA50B84|nr:phosphatidylinositol mannoside acyltransferase [Schaalia sp. ORNL0103]MBW6412778.1 phosphatidylinositol mannoside acyltransferase [Schaalia sp. ORNL0103]